MHLYSTLASSPEIPAQIAASKSAPSNTLEMAMVYSSSDGFQIQDMAVLLRNVFKLPFRRAVQIAVWAPMNSGPVAPSSPVFSATYSSDPQQAAPVSSHCVPATALPSTLSFGAASQQPPSNAFYRRCVQLSQCSTESTLGRYLGVRKLLH